jgi:transglutaminase-like putative cysteine protease
MDLQVVHRTRYRYSGRVTESFNETRLRPVSNEQQECLEFSLSVEPPAGISHYLDFYLNYVQFFEITTPHDELLVESRSRVRTSSAPAPAVPVPFASLQSAMNEEFCYDFLQPSAYVSNDVEVWRLARDICPAPQDVWQSALEITRFINANWAYAPNTTSVQTHMEDAVRYRHGVCQDFTHVMLGVCRSLGMPARYVSGYLFCDEGERLVGAQASHAWCEVYIPGHGWRGFDPTNNCPADEHHVKVAIGRDYADITPVSGTYRGSGDRTMDVEVDVRRTPDNS